MLSVVGDWIHLQKESLLKMRSLFCDLNVSKVRHYVVTFEGIGNCKTDMTLYFLPLNEEKLCHSLSSTMNNEHRKAFPKEMTLLYIPQAPLFDTVATFHATF